MKRHIFIASLVLLAGALVATSCIDDRYDLGKLDNEITILPGLSVNIDKNVDLPLGKVLPIDGDLIQLDKDKNYQMTFKSFGEEVTTITKEEFNNTGKVELNNSLVVLPSSLPINISNMSVMLLSPIALEIENTTTETLLLSGTIHKGNKVEKEFSGIEVDPGDQIIYIDDKEFGGLFNPFDQDIIIDKLKLEKMHVMPASVETPTKTSPEGEYSFYAGAFLPLEFNAGEGISFQYESDFFEESGIIEAFKDLNMDVETLDVTATIINEFPFDITVNTILNTDSGKISLDKTVAAGSPEKPASTDITINASDFGRMNAIKEVSLKIAATVPETFDGSVKLTADQKISIKVKDATLTDGLTIGKK